MLSVLPSSAATRPTGWLAFLTASLVLTGCARLNDTAKNLFVSSTSAVAMVGGQLLQGDLQVYSDYSGFIALASEPGATPLQCSGRLPNASTFGREIDLRCSNGLVAHLRVSTRSDLRGFAYGGVGEAATSLAFGLDASESAALLTVPKGMVLSYADGKYSLRKESAPLPVREPQLPPAEAAGGSQKPEEPATKPVPSGPISGGAGSPAPVAALSLGDQVAAKFNAWSQQVRKWMSTDTPATPATP
jgi:hypothetical protein